MPSRLRFFAERVAAADTLLGEMGLLVCMLATTRPCSVSMSSDITRSDAKVAVSVVMLALGQGDVFFSEETAWWFA